MVKDQIAPRGGGLDLARVLVVDDNPTSRLTLQTVLRAGGYSVDAAASAAEAVVKLDSGHYELVLSDLQLESPEAGLHVLAHARIMDYRPATALFSASSNSTITDTWQWSGQPILIEPEDVPELLGQVASLIGQRASRNLARSLRHFGN